MSFVKQAVEIFNNSVYAFFKSIKLYVNLENIHYVRICNDNAG